MRDFISEQLTLARREERKAMHTAVAALKGIADIDMRNGAWLVEQDEVLSLLSPTSITCNNNK